MQGFWTRRIARIMIQIGHNSNVGKIRSANEDFYQVVEPPEAPNGIDAIFVVADGMGGHAAGEVASRTSVDSVIATLSSPDCQLGNMTEQGLLEFLDSSFNKANEDVIEEGVRSPEKRGMGTTCTLGVIRGSFLFVAHIGDSRGYLFRDGVLSRITDDHSVVEEEVRRGLLTPEQAWDDPRRNIITRAIGLDYHLEVDTKCVELRSGDRIMFCSDGLNSMITDQEIESILSQGDAASSVQALIDAANDAGGSDNITVVVADTPTR